MTRTQDELTLVPADLYTRPPSTDQTITFRIEADEYLARDPRGPQNLSERDIKGFDWRITLDGLNGYVPEIVDVIQTLDDGLDDEIIEDMLYESRTIPSLARAEYDADDETLAVDLSDDHPALDTDRVEFPNGIERIDDDEMREIRVERDELIRTAQLAALNDHRNDSVRIWADGSTEIISESATRFAGSIRILVGRFVESHHTDVDAMREQWIRSELVESDLDLWADAMELRDEIPKHMIPTGEPIKVKYIDYRDE